MSAFFDLFLQQSAGPDAWKDPGWAGRQFPAVVAASPFRIWSLGDPVAPGCRLLIGVATWSGYDMQLLDVLAEALSREPAGKPTIEVFDIQECRRVEDFSQYVPGGLPVLQPPIVGLWQDGRLEWSAEGYAARDRVARMFGSNSDAIVEQVRERLLARSRSQQA